MARGNKESGLIECTACKRQLPADQFEVKESRNKESFTRSYCRECHQVKNNRSKSTHPYHYLANLCAQLKHSRVKQGIEWHLTTEHLKELWDKQKGRCALTGQYMTWYKGEGTQELNVSIDRIHPDKPYYLTNIQLICYRMNIMKHTLNDSELYWWCKNLVTTMESRSDDESGFG
jgi:hypothetical protein